MSTNIEGKVYQYQSSLFYNYRFKIPLESWRTMANIKLVSNPLIRSIFVPYLKAGVGPSWNSLSYKDKPLPNPGVSGGDRKLGKNNLSQLSYELGAGLKINITKNLGAGIEYLFVDLGKFKTSPDSTPRSPMKAIKLSPYFHSILFHLYWSC